MERSRLAMVSYTGTLGRFLIVSISDFLYIVVMRTDSALS